MTSIIDDPDPFSTTYEQARGKFLDVARTRKAYVQSFSHPLHKGPCGETLAVDVAVLGNSRSGRVLVIVSGTMDVRSIEAAKKAAAKLRRRGVQTVVITLGARGALVASEQDTQFVPGFKVKAIDTTAAGDVFNGAFAVALAEGSSLEQAVRRANAAAAISVTRMGAQPSAPTRRDIARLLKASCSVAR